MRKLFFVLATMTLISCAHQKGKVNLQKKVELQEVRSFEEIHLDIERLVSQHPEIDQETGSRISNLLEGALVKQQELRNQESKIFQLLLKRSLSDSSKQEDKDLARQLRDVYSTKSDNLLGIVREIKAVTENSRASDEFLREVGYIFREMR